MKLIIERQPKDRADNVLGISGVFIQDDEGREVDISGLVHNFTINASASGPYEVQLDMIMDHSKLEFRNAVCELNAGDQAF